MAKLNYKTRYNAQPEKGRAIWDPSETVPGESRSIQELFNSYEHGAKIPGIYQQGIFFDADDFEGVDLEKLNSMDLYDQHTRVTKAKETEKAYKAFLETQEAERKVNEQLDAVKDTPDVSEPSS